MDLVAIAETAVPEIVNTERFSLVEIKSRLEELLDKFSSF